MTHPFQKGHDELVQEFQKSYEKQGAPRPRLHKRLSKHLRSKRTNRTNPSDPAQIEDSGRTVEISLVQAATFEPSGRGAGKVDSGHTHEQLAQTAEFIRGWDPSRQNLELHACICHQAQLTSTLLRRYLPGSTSVTRSSIAQPGLRHQFKVRQWVTLHPDTRLVVILDADLMGWWIEHIAISPQTVLRASTPGEVVRIKVKSFG